MTRETFQNRTGDYSDTFVSVVQNGVLTYPTQYNETIDVHTSRSQASLMHDHMISEGKRQLMPPDFHYVKAKGRSMFNFQDCMLIQFKRLSYRMMPANYPTPQAELFAQLGTIDCLPGMDAAIPLITIGYIPLPFLAGIEGVYATYIENFRPAWSLRLDDSEEQEPPSPTISILPPHDPTPSRRTRIRTPNTGGSTATGAA